MSLVAELLTLAKKLDNFLVDATTNFDSTTNHRFTCPTGKRWFLLGGAVKRDVSGTLVVDVRNSSAELIHQLSVATAATDVTSYPCQASSGAHTNLGSPIILDTGDYVNITFGAAQSTVASISCVVLEVDI